MFDASGTLIAKSDRGAARIKEGVPNAGVTPGKYTLVVKQAPKKKGAKGKQPKGKAAPEPVATAPAPVYELTAVLGATSPGRERESDDDRGTANDLIVADNAIGYIGWANDRDVWKLSVETLSDKNAVDVQVSAIEGVALELEVADGLGQLLATRKAPKGQPVILRGLLPIVPAGAPPFYYLTLKGSASNPETTYTLHATAHVVGPDDEIEPNDSPDKPFAMPAERTVVHAVWTPGDIDCIGIAASDALRTIDVAIDTPAEIDLSVELLVDGKPVATANKGGKGVIEKLSALVPIGVRPVIRVKNPDANATIGGRSGLLEAKYDISVQETNATGDNAP
jgi:hypothetical protein